MASQIQPSGLSRRAFVTLAAAGAAAAVGMESQTGVKAGVNNSAAAPTSLGGIPMYKRTEAPIEERIADLLGRMTLAEKARQLDMYSGSAYVNEHRTSTHCGINAKFNVHLAQQDWGNLGIGGIHDLYPPPALANEIQSWIISHSRLGIPALFIEEGLHGYLGYGTTIFPQSLNLATTWNTGIARQTGAAIAAEARSNGIHMILGPVANLARDPRWGRSEETFGEDCVLSGRMTLAYVQGMHGESLASDHSVISEPKHFAGLGSPQSGLNTDPVRVGIREMHTIMLKAFEPAIREGKAMAIMAAYNEIDGIPCTANRWLLTDVLRNQWGFKGFVLSDLGAIRRLYDTHHVAATPQDAVLMALQAGVDMQFYDFDHAVYQNAIINGVTQRQLDMAAVDQAAARVLRAKFMLGLFDRPVVDTALSARVARSPQHLALSLESARQSMCLLKNEGGLLPLSGRLKRIAVIGPNAAAVRLGDYTAPRDGIPLVSMLDVIKTLAGTSAKIIFDDGSDIAAAASKAKNVDVVILGLGEHEGISGEGFDRSELDLPGNQQALMEAVFAVNPRVVLVLQNGRPLAIPWAAEHIPAILEAWYPGETGGQAIAETLFGLNNPAGRLPMSFPRAVGTLPVCYDFHPSKVGNYIEANRWPVFPFGHGLSYTQFRYEKLRILPKRVGQNQNIAIAVDVVNTGSRDGDEVVQVYLRDMVGSVETPLKALKDFRRVHIGAGKTRTVQLKITAAQLKLWNVQGRWAAEPGEFEVMVGGTSATGLRGRFKLA